MVDNQHWLDRWKENRIGFHESTVNRHLQKFLSQFQLSPGATLFMPLCGKALDIVWLSSQGYRVIGIELSRIAVEAFFEEQGLEYQHDAGDRFVTYRSGNITLLQGDFFDLRAEDLADCLLVYDRAALIAIESPERAHYYEHMLSILPAQADMLLITLEYDQAEMTGPPFSVPTDELYRYYADAFSITPLETESIIDEQPRWRKVGLTHLVESVFCLRR